VSEIIIPSGWRERLEELQTRRSGWIVAAFIVVAVTLSLFLWSRQAPAEIAPPATSAAPAVQAPAVAASASPTAGFIYVDVSGAVLRPGLYRLDAGARVADAIQAAGGPAARADLNLLNLAQPLSDGVKVEVGRKGAGAPPGETAAATPASSGMAYGASPSPSLPVVNINTADEPTLELIPGVGPVTATAILAYRDRIGRFSSIEQLLDVDGIGPATVENIRPYITL
jgi:competence protein ComEA